MGLLPDYVNQAESYDRTRGASPSVLAPLREALRGAPGRRLADIGGGTGNYAAALKAEGWDPLVIDPSEEMLERADRKGLRTLSCDALALSLDNESFDAVMLISMLHHVDDAAAALGEARRIASGWPIGGHDLHPRGHRRPLAARLLSRHPGLDDRDPSAA